MRRVYWDLEPHPFSSVIERMTLLLKEDDRAQDKTHLDYAFETLYRELGMEEEDTFYFCHHGEEAIYSILLSFAAEAQEKKHCILALEEGPYLLPLEKRLTSLGIKVTLLPVQDISLQKIQSLIQADTGLISLSGIHSKTGELYPIDVLAEFCHSQGIQVHVDGSWMLGIVPFCFSEHKIDFLSFDGATLRGPQSSGGVVVKKGVSFTPLFSYSGLEHTSALDGLAKAFLENARHFDHYHLEVSRLKNSFESKAIQRIASARVLFLEQERLPNYSTLQFQGVSLETLYYLLKRKGVHALLCDRGITFSLPFEVTEEEIDHVVKVLEGTVSQLLASSLEEIPLVFFSILAWEKYSKKLHHRIEKPLHMGSLSREEAQERKMHLAYGSAQNSLGSVALNWLVDESDGVVVEVRFKVFGPSLLIGLCDLMSELLVRKNYEQVKHISVEDVMRKVNDKEGALSFEEVAPYYSLILLAIKEASSQCLDIPFLELALPESAFDAETSYPDWPQFSKERQLEILDTIIANEIQPYIALDAGGVKIVDLVEGMEVIIAYEGSCTSCYSATGATLEAIERTLRAKIHPALKVTPDLSVLHLH